VLAIVLVASGVAFALTQVGKPSVTLAKAGDEVTPLPDKTIPATDGSLTVEATSLAASATTAPVDIEVPDVVGKSVGAAEALLQAAGFKTQTRVADSALAGVAPDQVVGQWPNAGARLSAGERVVVTYQPQSVTPQGGKQLVVVIDAGHQAKGDSALEPIGPGSKTMKTKVAGGATGVFTRIPEYKQTLLIAEKLRDKLQAKGIRVVMIRTSNDVNVSNAQRAIIGNNANADLVVRVHLDSTTSGSVHGISTLYPSGNAWVKPIEAESKRAANLVQSAVVRATGAASRGLSPRSDMTGFNWSKRPTIIVECGFMSNVAEDKAAATPAYRDKLASGIAAGVFSYLGVR